jgi:flagellar hook-basal body complex protein FliE
MSNTIQGMPPIDPAQFQRDIQRPASGPREAQPSAFSENLQNTLQQIEDLQAQADQKVADFVSGKSVDVHSVMISVEKADLSFQLMMQVRNKIVKAYQDIANMQF